MTLARPCLAQSHSAIPTFTAQEKADLKAGKMIRRPLTDTRKKGFYGGTGWTVIDAPMDVIWKAILDWESYPEAFPKTLDVREVSRKDDRRLIQMELGHKLIRLRYFVEVDFDFDGRRIAFRMLDDRPHDIDDSRGYWRFFPQKNGKTLVAYVVAARLPMGVVNLISPQVEERIEGALLKIPGFLKKWVEGPNGDKYRE